MRAGQSITSSITPGVWLTRRELWDGVQQSLIKDYGSDPKAGIRTQVLRLPGTLNLKDPAKPFLVRFVEESTSERIYTAADIAEAFLPRPQPERRRREPYRRRDALAHIPKGDAEQCTASAMASASR
jgi:hypothetical protein